MLPTICHKLSPHLSKKTDITEYVVNLFQEVNNDISYLAAFMVAAYNIPLSHFELTIQHISHFFSATADIFMITFKYNKSVIVIRKFTK